ncbi:MAG: DNA polymerase III subunit delta [Dehalococcoidia bacterium]
MLHLYTGSLVPREDSDAFRLHEAYEALRRELDTDGMLGTNTTVLPARGLAPDTVIQHLSTIPFLAQARLVAVEGLLGALGSRRGVLEQWQPLVDFLPVMPETSHLVLLDLAPEREDRLTLERSPLLRALRAVPGADVREFRALRLFGRDSGNEVARWIEGRARERGVPFQRDAAEALSDLVGADLWVAAGEIEKLGHYAAGRPVTVADVRLLTPASRDADVFALVDAVAEGRAPAALRLLRQLVEQGEHPTRLQAMIARQVRALVRAAELVAQGAPERAIGEATGITHSFPLGKLVRQAGAMGAARAEQALREIEAADYAVKTGHLEEGLSLELLVCRLAELAPRGATPATRR